MLATKRQIDAMHERARAHAEKLAADLGIKRAQEAVALKVMDAPFLVPVSADSGIAFWRSVAEVLDEYEESEASDD